MLIGRRTSRTTLAFVMKPFKNKKSSIVQGRRFFFTWFPSSNLTSFSDDLHDAENVSKSTVQKWNFTPADSLSTSMKQEGSPKPLSQLWSLLRDTSFSVDFHDTEEVSDAMIPLSMVLLDTRFTIDLDFSLELE